MTHSEHRKRHIELHHAFDELLVDYILHNSKGSIHDEILMLMRWSNTQTQNPTEEAEGEVVTKKKLTVPIREAHIAQDTTKQYLSGPDECEVGTVVKLAKNSGTWVIEEIHIAQQRIVVVEL